MTVQTILEICIMIGALGLALFCIVLARRLKRLNDLESGLGGAIAVMSAEIDRLEQSIHMAKAEATSASKALAQQIKLAQNERAHLNLQRQVQQASVPVPVAQAPSKLRKRRVSADA